jgi:hypothetical protein
VPAAKDPAEDESLKRLGGGRWQTRDERFTIEPQSGTWAVVDAEQTDDLGLPLVRGPFPSLTAAKAAIASARTAQQAVSPLAGRVAGAPPPGRPERRPERATKRDRRSTTETERPAATKPAAKAADRAKDEAEDEAAEPTWFAELSGADRGRARRLIRTLATAGIADAEGIVRRDLAGGVPAIAAVGVSRALDALGPDAAPDAVARALVEGRDAELDVRWRLVDGEGRPILLDRPARRTKR